MMDPTFLLKSRAGRLTARRLLAVALAAAGGGGAWLAAEVVAAPPRDEEFVDTVYYDIADERGHLTGGFMKMLVRIPRRIDAIPAHGIGNVLLTGDPANRIDIVYVGDGYTEDELDLYADEVDQLIAAYFGEEPFVRYAPFFNVHRVDVVSNESGVDNDPVQGIDRDTALDMAFWCNGTERLLCVDVGKAYSYADNAPDVDLVAAVANSSKYGGAGYLSADLATTSSRNSLSPEVILHEFGHALGNLADEYNYGGGDLYTGDEPPEPNASTYVEAEMLDLERKWHRWLGVNDPMFDGLVSTFEGCRYYRRGIYRPTNNSLMNALNRPFNLPSVESLIIEFYKVVDPIDDASDTSIVYDGSETLFITPLHPIEAPLEIQWYADGLPIPGATGETLDLTDLDLRTRRSFIEVRVVDQTEWVRDEDARERYMTRELRYEVNQPGPEDCLDLYVANLEAGAMANFDVYQGTPGARAVVLWGDRDGSFARDTGEWCVDFGFDVPANRVRSRLVTQGRFNQQVFSSRNGACRARTPAGRSGSRPPSAEPAPNRACRTSSTRSFSNSGDRSKSRSRSRRIPNAHGLEGHPWAFS